MQNLCVALGIDTEFYSNYHFKPQNRTINVRYSWLNRVNIRLEPLVAELRARSMHSRKLHRVIEKIISAAKSTSIALSSRDSNDKENIPIEATTKLADYYRPYNLALSEELRRPMPWRSFPTN